MTMIMNRGIIRDTMKKQTTPLRMTSHKNSSTGSIRAVVVINMVSNILDILKWFKRQ